MEIFKQLKVAFINHMKFSVKLISSIFDPPTRHGLIEHKTVIKLLTPNEIWCLFIRNWFLFSIRIKILHAATKCDVIFRGFDPVSRQKCGVFIFLIFGQTFSKNDKNRIFLLLGKNIFWFFSRVKSKTNDQKTTFK